MDAPSSCRLSSSSKDLDAVPGWRDFRESDSIESAQDLETPWLNTLIVKAIIEIDSDPWRRELKGQPAMKLTGIDSHVKRCPSVFIIRLCRPAINLTRNLCVANQFPAMPLIDGSKFFGSPFVH
jgi:hypothetical protein